MAIAQPTTQIDPTSGLIAYIQAIKPYHSKILDVLVEYVVAEDVSVTITEDFKLEIFAKDIGGEVIYTCGFGFIWNPYSQVPPALIPTANIQSIQGDPINEFTVTMPVQTPISVVVSNVKANQMMMVTPYNVLDVDAANMQWTVSGNVASQLPPNSYFFISSNNPSANGRYTVAAATYNSSLNRTTVTTIEPVSLLAQPTGKFNIPIDFDELPYWPPGAAIQLSTTGQMPEPLDPTKTYYFTPSKKVGIFNLSEERYPTEYADIVNLTNGGTGELTAVRSEPFVPGEFVRVDNTGGNDGDYTVHTIKKSGSTFIIRVLQRVPEDNPNADSPPSTMTYEGSFGDPYCAVAHAPPLHSETYIYEHLVFDFGPHPSDPEYDPPPYDVEFT